MKNQGRTNLFKAIMKENITTIIPFGDRVIICVFDTKSHRTLFSLEKKENLNNESCQG